MNTEFYEMTNSDFICLLQDCPSTDQEEIFNEAARRISNLELQRDEAREKAERYRLEANALMLQRDEAISKL